MPAKAIYNIGDKIGELTFLEDKGGAPRKALFKCKCGRGFVALVKQAVSLRTKSCGCLRVEKFVQRTVKHGRYKDPEYKIWKDMRKRCFNPNHKSYKNYGGRGIGISAEWDNSYESFILDMGRRPDLAYSVERINNELGYSRENCRWATAAEQRRNCRNTILVDHEGTKLCLKDWSEKLNLNYGMIKSRVAKGVSPKVALELV